MVRDRYINISGYFDAVASKWGLNFSGNLDDVNVSTTVVDLLHDTQNSYFDYLNQFDLPSVTLHLFNIFSLFPTVRTIYIDHNDLISNGYIVEPCLYDFDNIPSGTMFSFSDVVYYDLDSFFVECAVTADTLKNSSFYKSVLPPPTVSAPSLNGNGSEYIDGTEVTVSGRDTVYTVVRSYMTIYTDSGYTVHYDLEATNGAKLSSPEALLTKYVAPVITP